MSSISTAEQWLSQTTGGHPVLVPALILAGIVLSLAVVLDFIVTRIVRPAQGKLGLRPRGAAFESLRSTSSALADPEGPIVVVSPSGQCFLTLLPGGSEPGQLKQTPSGTAYKVQTDGQIHELWRVAGWYSFHECFLSDNGRYLVRVIDSPGGSDLEIAFYNRGDLVRQLSTSDLVASETNWFGSTSRSRGLSEPNVESSWPSFELSDDNTFRMTTADGFIYSFDVRTGEIIPADVRPEPRHGVPLYKVMFAAGACVALAGLGVFLVLPRRRLK